SDGSGQSVFMDDGRGAFTVEEELLEVPGMNRDIYEALRPWIHTQTQATAELNLRAAPEFLLEAWRGVDAAAVDFALESRQDDAPNVAAPAGSTVPFALGGSVYCVDVDVTL